MSVYEKIVDVSGTATYPTTPQVQLPFEPRIISVLNEGNSSNVYVSLDGQNDMGHLAPGVQIKYEQRCRHVWLRYGTLGAPPQNVQVVAED